VSGKRQTVAPGENLYGAQRGESPGPIRPRRAASPLPAQRPVPTGSAADRAATRVQLQRVCENSAVHETLM